MQVASQEHTAQVIAERAIGLGATMAGIASVADLKRAPSFAAGSADSELSAVTWPAGARSVLVVALAHPVDRPDMDWWSGRNDPPGNRLLAGIVGGLCEWIPAAFGIACTHLPYHVEKGGIYLKDAAVLAGLGCMGRNNLLVTRTHGPRVRLRALTMDADLPSTGPVAFDPCAGCDAPCHRACPRGAFVPSDPHAGAGSLPASGGFLRAACYLQMDADVAGAADGVIKYCRGCESSCPA